MTWLEIRPQDVWLFRDGKPFSAGEDHSAHSVFPPTPLTIQGAVRQKISASLGVSLREYKAASTPNAIKAISYVGEHGDLFNLGTFGMRGPFVSLRTDTKIVPLFPVPADLLAHENTDEKRFDDLFVTAPNTNDIQSDLSGFLFPQVREGYENLPAFWMTQTVFQTYLDNPQAIDPAWFVSESSDRYADAYAAYQDGKHIWNRRLIYDSENRFGVSTNALTSFRVEGQLYQVGFVRLHDGIELLVDLNDDIPVDHLTGILNIGGEHRQGIAAPLDEDVVIPVPSKPISGCFKVVFLTPAYFDDGWQPKDGDSNWSALFGHPVKLRSAVLYRPVKIGGWNSAAANGRGAPRTMHNYAAPGSVYYFETDLSFVPPEALTQNPDNINAAALGFGQYAIGQW